MTRAKKRFSQNFLHDRGVIQHILDLLAAEPDEHVLEIGPGRGALTVPLARTGARICAVELDRDMLEVLGGMAWPDHVRLRQGDAMAVSFRDLFDGPFKVVSNLPYQIAVPLLARLLRMAESIPVMVLMFQKEVADRIRAVAGNRQYGWISVLCQQFYEVDACFTVGSGAFSPAPKVTSAVMRFRRRDQFGVNPQQLEMMDRLVGKLFQKRRKMVRTILQGLCTISGFPDPGYLLECYLACGLDPQARPENIEPQAFARWIRAIHQGVDRASDQQTGPANPCE